MGFSYVHGSQIVPVDHHSAVSKDLLKLQDLGVVKQFFQLQPPFATNSLIFALKGKQTLGPSLSSLSPPLYIGKQAAITQEGKEACEEGQRGPGRDNLRASFLIRKLASFGHLEEVQEVFGSLQQPDAYAWSAVIFAHSDLGNYAQALKLYHEMLNSGTVPDGHVFLAVIKACSRLLDSEQGMHIHSCVLKYGLDSDVFLSNALVSMYAKVGNLEVACFIFKKGAHFRDVVTWSTLIRSYTEHGYPFEAYNLFGQMQQEGLQPNEYTLVCLLKACSIIGERDYGEHIHSLVIEHGFEGNMFITNTLMDMYVHCDSLDAAWIFLNKLSGWDVLTWSIIMGGYAERGLVHLTLEVFYKMQEVGVKPDQVTYVCLTKACQGSESLMQGRLVHSLIVESGQELSSLVGTAVVEMYLRCKGLEDAHAIFEKMSEHNLAIWAALISGYSQLGHSESAYQVSLAMEQQGMEPDKQILECLIKACSVSKDLEQGKQVHCRIVKFGMESSNAIGNALIDMYMESGFFGDARMIFDQLGELDVVTWNVMISRHAENGQGNEAMVYFERMQKEGFLPNQVTWNILVAAQHEFQHAFELFLQMQQVGFAPNDITFVCILQKCRGTGSLQQGMHLHSHIVKVGFDAKLVVQNTLIDMYAKNDSLEMACVIFKKLTRRDIITWNVLIGGNSMHGHAQESLQLFQCMQQDGVEPNQATFVALLQACSSIALLEHGRHIHNLVINRGFELDLHVGNTLIDFYSKCAAMEDAHVLLNRLPERDAVTWSTIISGHSKQCDYNLACQCFHDMQSESLEPNASSFLSILSACSQAGLLDEGCFHFKSMCFDQGIMPTLEHFMVLLELFGNVGRLDEAVELLETLPGSSNAVGWMTLLNSCKKHRSTDLAKQSFDKLMRLGDESSSGYVLLSNTYAHAGMVEASKDISRLRKCADAWKQPAKAYIELDNEVHDFVVGDTSHPRSDEIYSKLKSLNTHLKEEGYQPRVDLVKGESLSELKEMSLWAHSEKLAVALGLLCTSEGTTIRVAKNLRVCVDCHDVAKLISRTERRDIIIKDSHCLHHFKDGGCCCKDFD